MGAVVLDRLKALMLLSECTGDDIWSLEYCYARGIPEPWLEELQDCFESNPQRESEAIYLGSSQINQYEGIRDVDLAMRLGEFLGVRVDSLVGHSRRDLVRQIQQSVEEG